LSKVNYSSGWWDAGILTRSAGLYVSLTIAMTIDASRQATRTIMDMRQLVGTAID
jgi:hypothetical protein